MPLGGQDNLNFPARRAVRVSRSLPLNRIRYEHQIQTLTTSPRPRRFNASCHPNSPSPPRFTPRVLFRPVVAGSSAACTRNSGERTLSDSVDDEKLNGAAARPDNLNFNETNVARGEAKRLISGVSRRPRDNLRVKFV